VQETENQTGQKKKKKTSQGGEKTCGGASDCPAIQRTEGGGGTDIGSEPARKISRRCWRGHQMGKKRKGKVNNTGQTANCPKKRPRKKTR